MRKIYLTEKEQQQEAEEATRRSLMKLYDGTLAE